MPHIEKGLLWETQQDFEKTVRGQFPADAMDALRNGIEEIEFALVQCEVPLHPFSKLNNTVNRLWDALSVPGGLGVYDKNERTRLQNALSDLSGMVAMRITDHLHCCAKSW